MKGLFVAAGVVATASVSTAVEVADLKYHCVEKKCRVYGAKATPSEWSSHEACLLLCENSLWPLPTSHTINATGEVSGKLSMAEFNVSGTNAIFDDMVTLRQQQAKDDEELGNSTTKMNVHVEITDNAAQMLMMGTDESYEISKAVGGDIMIKAETAFGARHAIETLSQLIVKDTKIGGMVTPSSFSIKDAPAYPVRGAMVDITRNFMSVEKLQTTIKGMAANKLNTLHFHLTDTASFPFELENAAVTDLTKYGAYGKEKVYSKDDLKSLKKLALESGLRTVIEFDQPAHASQGWRQIDDMNAGVKDYENLTMCNTHIGDGDGWAAKAWEPPTGHFNPINEKVHEMISHVYKELVEIFDDSVFHLGGDEVLIGGSDGWACWNNSVHGAHLQKHIEALGKNTSEIYSFYELWLNFTQKSTASLEKAFANENKTVEKIMQWGSPNLLGVKDLEKTFIPSKFMFQAWDSYENSNSFGLMQKGFDVVISNADLFYLDCGNDGWVQKGYWCKLNEWYDLYDSVAKAVAAMPQDAANQTIVANKLKGAIAPLWAETYDDSNFLNGLFPRINALAERLWSNPATDYHFADSRMQQHRHRLVSRGVSANAMQPEWCYQHGPDQCTLSYVWHNPLPTPNPTASPTVTVPTVAAASSASTVGAATLVAVVAAFLN